MSPDIIARMGFICFALLSHAAHWGQVEERAKELGQLLETHLGPTMCTYNLHIIACRCGHSARLFLCDTHCTLHAQECAQVAGSSQA